MHGKLLLPKSDPSPTKLPLVDCAARRCRPGSWRGRVTDLSSTLSGSGEQRGTCSASAGPALSSEIILMKTVRQEVLYFQTSGESLPGRAQRPLDHTAHFQEPGHRRKSW